MDQYCFFNYRFFILIGISIDVAICVLQKVIVESNQGTIQGRKDFISKYTVYSGIPYATFTERFEVAGDAPIFKEIFIANNRNVICKQYDPQVKLIMGQEDCLTLNVYTPIGAERRAEPLAVLVFFYGGGYFRGTNSDVLYDPRFLVQRNVIVVKINYRVGAFGFLCLKNQGAPGNVGIKDKIAALRWIKNNIRAFGGDPNNITLFGESAGAVSINYLILTQTASGLFQRAIMTSGSITTPHLFNRDPIETAALVGRTLGANSNDTDELLSVYRKASANSIVLASIKNSQNDAFAPYLFTICVEDPNVSKNPIVTMPPEEILNSATNIDPISIIQCFNDMEGIMWAAEYDKKGLNDLKFNFSSAIPDSYLFKNEEAKQAFIDKIMKFYFSSSEINSTSLVHYFSDILIMHPSAQNMNVFLNHSNIDMYNCYFKYSGLRNLNKISTSLRFLSGASHADELFYLFDPIFYKFLPTLPDDQRTINYMTELWTNFAKTGNPSGRITWTSSSAEGRLRFLEIGSVIKMTDLPNQERIDFITKALQQVQ